MSKNGSFIPINSFEPMPFQLLVVRYADCVSNTQKSRQLNANGKKSINTLLDRISKNLIGNERIGLLSSNAPRALASSLYIFHKLDGVNAMFVDNSLRLDYQYSEDFESAFQMVKNLGNIAEIVIIVTNSDYANTFPRFFTRKISENNKSCEIFDIPKGGGVWIDQNLNAKIIK